MASVRDSVALTGSGVFALCEKVSDRGARMGRLTEERGMTWCCMRLITTIYQYYISFSMMYSSWTILLHLANSTGE